MCKLSPHLAVYLCVVINKGQSDISLCAASRTFNPTQKIERHELYIEMDRERANKSERWDE